MPYITQEARKVLNEHFQIQKLLDAIANYNPSDLITGNLNYIITSIIHSWIKRNGLQYENINAAIGVLDCAKMELYRMIAAPYENKKKAENGCISELDRITKDEKQAIWKCKKCGEIFKDNEVIEVYSHEIYYQCPNRECRVD